MFIGLTKVCLMAMASLVVFSSNGFSSDLVNVGPIKSGDVSAYVDFQIEDEAIQNDVWQGGPAQGPESFHVKAKPIWVNILRENLGANDKVFVQIIQYAKRSYRTNGQNVQNIIEMDLQYAEQGRFTGNLGTLTLGYQFNDGYALSRYEPTKHEIVIWVNGTLYKNSQGNNLELSLKID